MYAILVSIFVLLSLSVTVHGALSQSQLVYISENLDVNIEVEDNLKYNGAKHNFILTFTNTGSGVIPGSDWMLYFCSFFMLENLPQDGGYVVPGYNIRLNHVQGCLFSLEPVTGFKEIQINQSTTLEFYGANWAVTKSDIPPNWYVTSGSLEPRVIKRTVTGEPFVADFNRVNQWKRYRDDRYNPFTADDRYSRYNQNEATEAENLVIPTPAEMIVHSGTVDITDWKVTFDEVYRNEGLQLAGKLNLTSVVSTGKTNSNQKHIYLCSTSTMTGKGHEAYELRVNKASSIIVINAGNKTGLFYACQTLMSLTNYGKSRVIPEVHIKDWPRFEYRGMYVDISRNFHGKEELTKIIDAMATYKLNVLHLHLSDDEGWRIEIPGIPELTEIASRRCHDLADEKCLISQLGSGPDNTTSGSGYLTMSDYTELVKHAQSNHIRIIPEIDSPGHARAPIKAMEARYRKYNTTNITKAEEYLLTEPGDPSHYLSNQMYNDNAINPCLNSTYTFFTKVISELKKVHEAAGQPLEIFHFGGDETPLGAWVNSTACNNLLEHLPLSNDTKQIKRYFVDRMTEMGQTFGLDFVGWEDGWIDGKGHPYDPTDFGIKVMANSWDNVWEWGTGKRAYQFANLGYKVILSHTTHLYFDFPQEPDPEERGLYWGTRFTDTRKTFGYIPSDVYKNIDTQRSGKKTTKQEVCKDDKSGCPDLEKPENILGMQGHVWSETVLTADMLYYMVFPRFLALAERAWHKAPWEVIDNEAERNMLIEKDWPGFAKIIGNKELFHLDDMGIKYRVPPPGVRRENGHVFPTVTYPGLKTEFNVKDGEWEPTPVTGIAAQDGLAIRTRSADGRRFSRAVIVTKERELPAVHQSIVNYMANHLDVKLTVLDNLEHRNLCSLQLKMTNKGMSTIPAATWCIYMDNIRLLQPDDYPYRNGYLLAGTGLKLYHVSGSLYRVCPDVTSFKPIEPKGELLLRYQSKYFQSARTDFMPNFYVWGEGMEAKTIKSTEGEQLSYVSDFTSPRQWKRYKDDRYDPFTAQERYVINKDVVDLKQAQHRVIPTPIDMKLQEDKATMVTSDWVVVNSTDFYNAVNQINETFSIAISDVKPGSKYIQFIKGDVDVQNRSTVTAECYKIEIDATHITITATHAPGAFYAVNTLHTLSSRIGDGRSVPNGYVIDGPRFEYRGLHLDVGRNFHDKHQVMKLLDAMATYKLNKFHFHLSEDEGWRLEIEGLPELTEIGSQRCHDVTETECILPQLGSGPTKHTSGSGFYTKEDYQDILRYANDRHIQVIPEFDMPGHVRAAAKSMEARYLKYKKSSIAKATEFILQEKGDPSQYLSVQWFHDNALNPCMNSSFAFISHVINAVKAMHAPIQPLSLYHFGGDEVAHGAWINSSLCKEFMKSRSDINDTAGLQKLFVSKVTEQIANEGLSAAAWEDGLLHKEAPYDRNMLPRGIDIYSYAWDNIAELGKSDRAYKLANAGYKVVLSHATHLYFDHPHEPDPEERGYYWATRYTDTRKTFGYMPDNFFENADVTRAGIPLQPNQTCGQAKNCTKLVKPENIVGIQGQLWSETVRTEKELYSMIFPRLIALAERAWHKASWEDIQDKKSRDKAQQEDWTKFANTLGYKILRDLDRKNISYRVPPPGGVSEDGVLQVNCAFPGMTIQYSTNGGKTWQPIDKWSVTVSSGANIKIRTMSADFKRESRVVSLKDENVSVLSNVMGHNSCLAVIVTSFILFLSMYY